jgi:hypothetical protein
MPPAEYASASATKSEEKKKFNLTVCLYRNFVSAIKLRFREL